MVAVYIGLGSNIGQRKKNILRALKLLSKEGRIKVIKKSSVYETRAVGPRQRNFFNSVVKAKTGLSPNETLKELKKIEKIMGRKKTRRWGPRIIDLDLLFYGDKVIETKGLTVPHKEIRNRQFVLDPLCEIAPGFVHPVFGKTIRRIASHVLRSKTLMQNSTHIMHYDIRSIKRKE